MNRPKHSETKLRDHLLKESSNKTIWVLFTMGYDDGGEPNNIDEFKAWWSQKPTEEQLAEIVFVNLPSKTVTDLLTTGTGKTDSINYWLTEIPEGVDW